MQPIPGRSGLVAKLQRLVTLGQLAYQLGHGIGRVGKLPKIAQFPFPAALRHGHSIPRLRSIDPDKRLPMSPHGSSPIR